MRRWTTSPGTSSADAAFRQTPSRRTRAVAVSRLRRRSRRLAGAPFLHEADDRVDDEQHRDDGGFAPPAEQDLEPDGRFEHPGDRRQNFPRSCSSGCSRASGIAFGPYCRRRLCASASVRPGRLCTCSGRRSMGHLWGRSRASDHYERRRRRSGSAILRGRASLGAEPGRGSFPASSREVEEIGPGHGGHIRARCNASGLYGRSDDHAARRIPSKW